MAGLATSVSGAQYEQAADDAFIVDMSTFSNRPEESDDAVIIYIRSSPNSSVEPVLSQIGSICSSFFKSFLPPPDPTPRPNRDSPAYSSSAPSDLTVTNVLQTFGKAVNSLTKGTFNFIDQLRTTDTVVSLGLRKEVPFERWYYDHGLDNPIKDDSELMNARIWAVIAVGEGVLRTIAAVASYAILESFQPEKSAPELDILKAQWRGFTLSLIAIASPNMAKENVYKAGRCTIGNIASRYEWGTEYTG